MALYVPTYDGIPIFGYAVKIRHQSNPSAQQINAFFGVQGNQSVFGGGRGRVFMIEGLFVDSDPAYLRASHEALLLSYADGVARELKDTLNYVWPYVTYKGVYTHGDILFTPNGSGGYCMPYKCLFDGLL